MAVIPILDLAQLRRIESVHRGFLYQHLFAVGCLLRAAEAGVRRVVVEADEDVQLELESYLLYVQIKTRSESLSLQDIVSSLSRFSAVRALHASGERPGTPILVIVSNVAPSGPLEGRLAAADWPPDVFLRAPGYSTPYDHVLPPPWRGLGDALDWCTSQAERVPLRTLGSLNLVWKLAAQVQLLASGHFGSHHIDIADLPTLFEQLLRSAQPDPEPAASYRPQVNEPQLGLPDIHVRLLLAPSGFGKTAWAAEVLLHSPFRTAYYDVTSTLDHSLASSVFVELCARLYGGTGELPAGLVLPGSNPIVSLKALDVALRSSGDPVWVILDDVQRATPEDVAELVKSTTYVNWVLLGHPSPQLTVLQALLGVQAETFDGWSEDTVAAVCAEAGNQFSLAEIVDLRGITAGAPLYVLNLSALSASAYDQSVGALCAALRAGTHAQRTTQEAALSLVSDRLSARARGVASLAAVAQVRLSLRELARVAHVIYQATEQETAHAVRELTDWRVLQGTRGGDLQIQDAFRLVLASDSALSPAQRRLAELEVKELLLDSTRAGTKDTARLYRFLELLGTLGQWSELIDLTTSISEWLRELGISSHIYSLLEQGAADSTRPPTDVFWLSDTLAFLDLSEGRTGTAEKWLARMETALTSADLGPRAQSALALKRMMLAGLAGDYKAARGFFEARPRHLDDAAVDRIFRHNYALIAWQTGELSEAKTVIWSLLQEHLASLGLSLEDILQQKEVAIWRRVRPSSDGMRADELKHTGDAFDLLAHVQRGLGDGRRAMLSSIQAFKFFNMSGAISSLVRVGEDVAEDMLVTLDDPHEARRFLEQALLPAVADHRLTGPALSVRSQYAFVLARCGEPDKAMKVLSSLEAYAPGLDQAAQRKLAELREFIGAVPDNAARIGGASTRPPPELVPEGRRPRVGRNSPCPCGSGKKYKRCCGR